MASITLGIGVGVCSISQAQVGGGGMGGAMPNVPGTAFGGATDPSSIGIVDGLRVVPSVRVSEQYDSNVFFAPKNQLQGLTPEDFVTSVAPQVRALYSDRRNLVKVNGVWGASGNYYANNTGLSYVGTNGGVSLDMSNLVSQWRPGARWTVSDTFFYTPQPPAFILGDQSGEQVNPLVAGFQATRAKTTSNSVNTAFEFPLSQNFKATGSYTNSFIRYGASQTPQAAKLITQEFQEYIAGLLMQLSAYDTAKVNFISTEFDQGAQGEFRLRGGAVVWTHTISPAISFNATAGAQELSGEIKGVQFSSVIAPIGGLAIIWKDPTTSITLAYRSGITPSFQFVGGALLSHSASINMTQSTPIRDLVGLFGANYSVANEYGSNSGSSLSWTTVGGSVGLLYRVTQKTFINGNYVYQNIDNVLGGTHFAYDKHIVQLGLTQAFY